MSIRITIPKIGNINFSSTPLMRSIGQGLIGRIRERTSAGMDAEGRPFQSLSRSYRKQKIKYLGTASADLTVSGRMLNDMQAKPRPDGVRLEFRSGGGGGRGGTFIQRSRAIGAAEKAYAHNISGAGRSRVKREFFALSDKDLDFVEDRVVDFIAKQL